MTEDNPKEEKRRLAETYAACTDLELKQIGQSAGELTDLAQEAFRAEMQRRALEVDLDSLAAEEEQRPALKELVTIRQFRDLPEALLAKGSLESAGIACSLSDDNLVRLDWFWSNLVGGIRLKVAPEDAELSDEILNLPIPEDLDVPGIGDYHQPRCPECHSLDVAYQELNKPVAYISAYLSIPIPLERLAWRCHACHAEWEEEIDPPEDAASP